MDERLQKLRSELNSNIELSLSKFGYSKIGDFTADEVIDATVDVLCGLALESINARRKTQELFKKFDEITELKKVLK